MQKKSVKKNRRRVNQTRRRKSIMRGGNKVQLIILLVTLVASLALSNAPHVKHDSQLAHLPEHFVGESFSGPILLPENNVSPAPDFDPYYQIFRINKIILSIVENNEKIRNINDVEEKLDNMASTASEEFYKDTPLDNFNRPKLKEGLKKEMHKHWRLENGKIFLEENYFFSSSTSASTRDPQFTQGN